MASRRLSVHVTSLLLAITLAPSALAGCLASGAPREEMACCQKGADACDAVLQPEHCCHTYQAADRRSVAIKGEVQIVTAAPLHAVPGPATVPSVDRVRPVIDTRAARARAPSPPLYVLSSAYLI